MGFTGFKIFGLIGFKTSCVHTVLFLFLFSLGLLGVIQLGATKRVTKIMAIWWFSLALLFAANIPSTGCKCCTGLSFVSGGFFNCTLG